MLQWIVRCPGDLSTDIGVLVKPRRRSPRRPRRREYLDLGERRVSSSKEVDAS